MPGGIGNIGQWAGVNSGIDPESLQSNVAFQGMNTISRGGIQRTRPGFRSVFNGPSGHPQGSIFFTNSDGVSFFVFAVNGYVYASKYPFTQYYALPNIRFSPRSLHVVFTKCEQTTTYDADGNFVFLAKPLNVLLMQDGRTRSAFWDGTISRHLNPIRSSGEFTEEGKDETPLGLWMSWSNDRLWVFRDNQGFASDIGNPLKFTETQYLSEARAFLFPGTVTGAVQPYAGSPLVVFTSDTMTQLQAQIRDRTKWAETNDFQRTEYTIGCVSGKSIVKSFGMTWWFSEYGVVNLDFALQTFNESKFQYVDNQMAISKAYLSPTLDRVCSAVFENYVMFSVPSGDIYNRHTWVLDQLNTPEGQAAWDGFWTGIRPIEWATAKVEGRQRIFALSYDEDNITRIWEAFDADRNDNGCAITCMLETGRYNNDSKNLKKFKNARLFLDGLEGESFLSVRVASEHGPYNEVMNHKFISSQGSVMDGYTDEFIDFLPQNRRVNTEYLAIDQDGCNECGVETESPNDIGTAFSLQFLWTGSLGIQGFQMIMEEAGTPSDYEPDCPDDETGDKIVTAAGATTTDRDDIPNCATEFESEKTDTAECATDEEITALATVSRTGVISQEEADARAECAASVEADANNYLCNDNGDVTLPGEQPWEDPDPTPPPPVYNCCPDVLDPLVDFLETDGTDVIKWDTDAARAHPLNMDIIGGHSVGYCWWTHIDELGTLWEYNQQVNIGGTDYWVYSKLYHDGTGWFLETILQGTFTGTLKRWKRAAPGLPATADGDCYHIGVTFSYDPFDLLNFIEHCVTIGGQYGFSGVCNSELVEGMKNYTDWRTGTPLGTHNFFAQTAKGTGAIHGRIGQLCVWTTPAVSAVSPINQEDFETIFNNCAGLDIADFATTAKFTGGFLTDLLYHYYDFGNKATHPKYYNEAVLGDGQDYIELAAFEPTGPEDTLTPTDTLLPIYS